MWTAIIISTALAPAVADVAERLQLRWEAPPACPSEAEVRDRIGAYLGRDEFDETVDDVRVDARVASMHGGAWALTVEVRVGEESVRRRIEAPRCADTRDAAALIIAVALDPLRVSRQAPPPWRKPATTESPPSPPAARPPPVTPIPVPPSRRRWADVRVGGVMEVGAAPRVTGGVALEVALVGRRFRVGLVSRYLPPRTVRPFDRPSAAGVRVQTGVLGVRGCFVPSVGRIELPSCAQIDAGATRAEGVDLQISRVTHRPWVTAAVGQEIVWHSRRGFGAWIAVDAAATLVAPRFVVDDLGTVYTPGWAAFRLLAGPSARF
jgi:hypothetical protein